MVIIDFISRNWTGLNVFVKIILKKWSKKFCWYRRTIRCEHFYTATTIKHVFVIYLKTAQSPIEELNINIWS